MSTTLTKSKEKQLLLDKDRLELYFYAKDVIKGRWLEAEKYIVQDIRYWNEYSKLVRDYIHKLFA